MNFDIYLYFSFMYYYLYFSFKVRIIECMTKGCRMCFFVLFCFVWSTPKECFNHEIQLPQIYFVWFYHFTSCLKIKYIYNHMYVYTHILWFMIGTVLYHRLWRKCHYNTTPVFQLILRHWSKLSTKFLFFLW